jgi:excisionase family DNA binding protein
MIRRTAIFLALPKANEMVSGRSKDQPDGSELRGVERRAGRTEGATMRNQRKTAGATEAVELRSSGPLTFCIALEGTLMLSPVGEIGISFKRQLAEEKPAAREPVQLSESKLGYSISEITKLLPVSRSTLYQEIKSGALIARKIAGRRTVILRADLDRWISRTWEI